MHPDAPTDVTELPWPQDGAADWLLASWARVIERLGGEYPEFGLGVTLNVGGSNYSGLLVSGGRWADEMANMLQTRSVDHRVGRALAESFEDERDRYSRPDLRDGPLRFLHLLHAALVDGHGERTGEGLPMRFRLDAVAAWAIAGWSVGGSNATLPDPGFSA
jgi:hypothetical protein